MFKYKNYFLIVFGCFISAFGIYNIHRQTCVTEGGLIGLSLLLYHYFKLSIGISAPFFDLLLYFFGAKHFGVDFLKRSIFATISYAFFYNILTFFDPVFPSFNDKPLIGAILGGLFIGVGAGLIVSTKTAGTGDDSLALLISKFFKINVGYCYVISDFSILILSISYIGITRIVYSLITVTISSCLIAFISKKIMK